MLIGLLGAGLLCLTPAEAGLRQQVIETVLPNGLKVLLLENHKAPVVTFQVWYRVGSRNEAWGKTGLSHMLEHMMFKGTQHISAAEFVRRIRERGGTNNAFTSKDFTAYFETLSAEHVQVAVELEADRMQHLVLREEDFHTERQVVMEERRLRTEDNPTASLLEQLEATAYQTSPYHWPTIGWVQDLRRLTLPDLQEYYRTYYNPGNAFVVVVGDVNPTELLPEISQAFSVYPPGIPPPQDTNVDPPQVGERRINVRKEAQLPFLALGYHVPNLRDADSYVLEVIAAILAQGESSRLFQSLVREKRLVLHVDADHALLSRDPGLFTLTATLLPGKEVAEVERAFDQEIARWQHDTVGERELEKAKNQLEATFVFGQDSAFYQAMLLARYEIADSWRAIDEYVPAIRKVSAADVQRVSQRYLLRENRTVGTLVPLPIAKGKPAAVGAAVIEHVGR